MGGADETKGCSETSAYQIQKPENNPKENATFRTQRKFEVKKSIYV
jgi:hypothetical protein